MRAYSVMYTRGLAIVAHFIQACACASSTQIGLGLGQGIDGLCLAPFKDRPEQ